MFPGSPQRERPTLPKRGDKLPAPRRHSTKLWFDTHDKAVAFCKSQKRHLPIVVKSILIDDKLVKRFIVDFAPAGAGQMPSRKSEQI